MFRQESFSDALFIERVKRNVEYLPNLVAVMRIAIAVAVLVFYLLQSKNPNSVVRFDRLPLYVWEASYAVFIFITLFFPQMRTERKNSIYPIAINLLDILMIILLTHIAGGVETGFGIFVLPFIAVACFTTGGRNALAYASFATILLFLSSISQLWLNVEQQDSTQQNIILSAFLSLACFFVALMSAYGSVNIRRALNTISRNEDQIAQLSNLNKLVLEHAQEGLIVLKHSGKVVLFNNQAKKYLPELFLDHHLNELETVVKKWHEHIYHSFEEILLCDGQELQLTAVPLTEQEPPLLLISLRSSAEIAQASRTDKLASLGQLTANLAHEIRNPLAAISQANELLHESLQDDPDSPYLALVNIVNHNTKRINRMIQEIQAVNRSDNMQRKNLSVHQFLNEFLTEFVLSHPDAQGCLDIRTECPENTYIYFDDSHLQQILDNLMNNAWKYCDKGEFAIQIATRLKVDNNELVISVADNGPGIPPENAERIFEPFFTTSKEGTGLGLYVAQNLAQANNAVLRYRATLRKFELIVKAELL
ncbi:MAG: hypothetical protein IJ881_00450 [Neisseriaceae bacterium]|nr:hypothetical protein [Neisseriaceae bacterium]